MKLRPSKGWSGWWNDDSAAGPAVSVDPDRPVDHIEQLADGHRRRALGVGPLVAAGVGDDEALGGGEEGVEQQLGVLAATVPVADVRVDEDEVVPVALGLPGEGAVVEAEQADDAVGDRPHRHQRADGQVAGAEVRPGGLAPEAVGEQRAELGQLQLGGAAAGLGEDVVEDALQLGSLPAVVVGGGGEGVGGAGDRLHPAGGRPGGRRGRRPPSSAGRPVRRSGRRGRWTRCRRRRAGRRRRPGAGPRRPWPRRGAPGRGRRSRCSGPARRGGTAPGAVRRGPTGCRSRPPIR